MIPALWRLQQEGLKLRVSLGYGRYCTQKAKCRRGLEWSSFGRGLVP